MKGKPIEPGCLAMIVNSKYTPENNGRVVRVVRRTEAGWKPPEIPESVRVLKLDPTVKHWVVAVEAGQQPLFYTTAHAGTNIRKRIFAVRERSYSERRLIRLDDDEAPKEVARTVVKSKPVDEVI